MELKREYSVARRDFYFKHQCTVEPICGALSRHSHNLCELLYFVKGEASYVIEDKKYKLRPGDLVLIRPSKYHFIEVERVVPYERYDILFDESELGAHEQDMLRTLPDVTNLSDGSIACEIFRRFDVYRDKLDEEEFSHVAWLLLRELFYGLHLEREQTTPAVAVVKPLLSRAIEYINGHLFELRDIGEIASALFITESYLFKLFRTELGQSPKKYVNDKRLLAAQQMLREGRRPTEAYAVCGFRDYVSFYRGYRRLFGRAPSEERLK